MDRRRLLVSVAAAVVLAVALVLLLAGGEEDVTQGPPTTVGTTPAPDETSPPQGGGSDRTERPGAPAPRQTPPEVLTDGARRDVARTIGELVQAVELGDGEAFCTIVGRRPGQAEGLEALRACGRQARIDPFALPTSDELSVSEVEVSGASAVARLGGGQTATLERSGGRWRVRSFAAARR